MTRDAEHTPSPQSVVVPVEPTLATFDTPDFAARTHAPHMESWAYNQMPKAGWSDLKLFQYDGTDLYQWFGKKTGSVFEDAEGEPFAIKPAAPAPSSLAGGEVLTDALDAWIVDGLKKADQRLAEIDPAGCSGMTPDDVKSGRVAAYQKGFQNGVKSTLTDASFVIMNAALSPEAPARSWLDARAVAKAMNPALFSHDKVEAHRAASPMSVTVARSEAVEAVRKVLDAAGALTPRHEAPAELLSNPQELEAPAEGAGEREARLDAALTKINAIRNSIIGCQRMHFSEHVYPLVAALEEAGYEGDAYEKCRDDVGTLIQQRDAAELALAECRARSSAPEASEGEGEP